MRIKTEAVHIVIFWHKYSMRVWNILNAQMASREVDYIAEVAGEVSMDSDTFLDKFSSSITTRIHCNTMNPH